MNHDVLTEYLADYLEGDLALDKRALVDAHLDTCERCAQEVREMQQTIRLLRALPQPEVPPMIAANVMRRIRAGETEPSFFERVQRVLGGVLEPSFVLPASAVAVAALVIVVIQGGGPLSRSLAAADAGAVAGEQRAELALEVGRSAETEEGAQVAEQEIDRAFGAPAVEPTSEASRALADAEARNPDSEAFFDDPEAHARPDPEGHARDAAESLARDGAEAFALDRTEARALDDPAGDRPAQVFAQATREGMATSPSWEPRRPRAAAAPSRGTGAMFGGSALAQGFASEVAGPATGFANRIPGAGGAGTAAVPVTASRSMTADSLAPAAAGGEDPRDAWLARALEHPADFARYIARQNLAEQELWVERLTERARSRGLLGELIEALRSAGDEQATWLAEDFAAQAADESTGEPRPEIADDPGRDRSR